MKPSAATHWHTGSASPENKSRFDMAERSGGTTSLYFAWDDPAESLNSEASGLFYLFVWVFLYAFFVEITVRNMNVSFAPSS